MLLDRGADIGARDYSGDAPLHFAAFDNDSAVVALLLERGADVTAQSKSGDTPLHYAAFGNEPAVITLLLDRGADIAANNKSGDTALRMARSNTHPGVIALLLDRGAGASAASSPTATPTPASRAATPTPEETPSFPWIFAEGDNVLHQAALEATPADIEDLLAQGADIKAVVSIAADGRGVFLTGWTPLHSAAGWNQDPAVAALLLDRGAEINARNSNGSTPLHLAAQYNPNSAVAELLVDRDADLNARDHVRFTPCQWARISGYFNATPLLQRLCGSS